MAPRRTTLACSTHGTNACSASCAPPHPVPLPLPGRGDRNGSLSLFHPKGRGGRGGREVAPLLVGCGVETAAEPPGGSERRRARRGLERSQAESGAPAQSG